MRLRRSDKGASRVIETDFRPVPLLSNGHIQTLLGSLLSTGPERFATLERHVSLPDGDQLVLQDSVPDDWSTGGPIVVLVHGLGGSHRSGYMLRVADRVLSVGVRAVRMDLRGCGRGLALARKPYHGGCSEDVRAVVAALHAESPASAIVLLGFSLGGNIVLKLAGEAADRPVPGLAGVAAVSPPIDFAPCAARLALPSNRLYELYFLRSLLSQVRERQTHFPEEQEIRFPRRMTMQLFDDLYTSPRCGFADHRHYYRSAAALPLISRIAVPALLLTARDDPFIVVEPFETLAAPPHVRVVILPRGGHLGFLAWSGKKVVRWAEDRIVDWVLRLAGVGKQEGRGARD